MNNIITYEPLLIVDEVAHLPKENLIDKDRTIYLNVNPHIPTSVSGNMDEVFESLNFICTKTCSASSDGVVYLDVDFEWSGYDSVLLKFETSTSDREAVYSFCIIQKVIDSRPSVYVDYNENIYIGAYISNIELRENFVHENQRLGIECELCSDESDKSVRRQVKEWYLEANGRDAYFFVEEEVYSDDLFDDAHEINVIVITKSFSDESSFVTNDHVKIMKRPVSIMNLGGLYNHTGIVYRPEMSLSDVYNYTAKEAKILIVDDSNVDLNVAKGILEPIGATIDLAKSGVKALEMVASTKYDLILMDHLMPGMDGIETTHRIRETYPEYNNIPIIALTGYVVTGARELLLGEGLDDYVSKPIEIKILLAKVRDKLPRKKIINNDGEVEAMIDIANLSTTAPVIADLDTESAIQLLGSESLYMDILKIYYESINMKADTIDRLYKEENWYKYAIEVHALKSSSRQIGARELGDLAYELEIAGKNFDVNIIRIDHDKLIQKYKTLRYELSKYFDDLDNNDELKEATHEDLDPIFEDIKLAIDNLDMDAMDEAIKMLNGFSFPEMWEGKIKALRNAVRDMDTEECLLILDSWN